MIINQPKGLFLIFGFLVFAPVSGGAATTSKGPARPLRTTPKMQEKIKDRAKTLRSGEVDIYSAPPGTKTLLTLQGLREFVARQGLAIKLAREELRNVDEQYIANRRQFEPKASLSANYGFTSNVTPSTDISPETESISQSSGGTLGVSGQIVQGLSYNISAPAFSRSMTGMTNPRDMFQLSSNEVAPASMLSGQYSDQSSVSLGLTANLVKGSYWAQGRFADRKINIDRTIGQENFRAALIKAHIEAEQAFYDVIQKQIRLRIAERALETAKKLAADLKEMVEVGESDKIALLRSQQQIAIAEIDLNAAKTEYSDSREKLRELLSMKADEFAGVYPDAQEILKLPDRPTMTVDQAVTEGLANRPDLKVQDLNLEKQSIDTRVSGLNRLPNLDLSLNYSKSATDQGFGQTTDQAVKQGARAMSLTLSTSYQLFGNTDFDSFRQSKIALEKARLNREKTVNQVSKEITSAMERLRISYIRLEHAKSNREISEDKVSAEYEKFIVGESDNKNLIDAQNEVTQSRIAELQAYIEVRNTTSALNQALGKGAS